MQSVKAVLEENVCDIEFNPKKIIIAKSGGGLSLSWSEAAELINVLESGMKMFGSPKGQTMSSEDRDTLVALSRMPTSFLAGLYSEQKRQKTKSGSDMFGKTAQPELLDISAGPDEPETKAKKKK